MGGDKAGWIESVGRKPLSKEEREHLFPQKQEAYSFFSGVGAQIWWYATPAPSLSIGCVRST